MDVWVWAETDLVCGDCAEELGGCDGPHPDGGGEADTPQHCAHCGIYLDNSWTQDCVNYVVEALEEWPARGRVEVLREWRDVLVSCFSEVLTPEQYAKVEKFNELEKEE